MFWLMLDVMFLKAVIGTCPFQASHSLFYVECRLPFILEQDVRIPLFPPRPLYNDVHLFERRTCCNMGITISL